MVGLISLRIISREQCRAWEEGHCTSRLGQGVGEPLVMFALEFEFLLEYPLALDYIGFIKY